jgi:hypothetical protein
VDPSSGFGFLRAVRRALPLVVVVGLVGAVLAPAMAASSHGKFQGCAKFVSAADIQKFVVYESVHYAVRGPRVASQTTGGPAFISSCTFVWVKNPPDWDPSLPRQTVATVWLYYHVPAKSLRQLVHAGYHKAKFAANGCEVCAGTVDLYKTTEPEGTPPLPTSTVIIIQPKTRDYLSLNLYTATSPTAIALAEGIYRRIFKAKAFAK